jgi:hypothetical protein
MARVTLTPTALAPLTVGSTVAGVADPAGTASVAGAGNGFTIAAPSTGSSQRYLFLRVANASGGSGTISVLAGTQPLANASGRGPLTVTVANTTTQWVGPFDSSIVEQNDGSLSIETSVVMTVTAFTLDGRRV